MSVTVFFSWQSDTPTRVGRNLIQRALERALSRIGKDTGLEAAIRELTVDRDTKGVGGFIPIVDTIFRKIDNAAIFVPDLTFVGKRLDARPTPNPNVLIEYGWALKSMTHGRIVAVMNSAYGEPTAENMPFDMLHLRRPICYDCREDSDEEAKKEQTEKLAKELEMALRIILDSAEFRDRLPKPPAPAQFSARLPVDGEGRFKGRGVPLGIATDGALAQEIILSNDPVIWFRLTPTVDPGRAWSVAELQKAATEGILQPVTNDWRGYNFIRSHEGFGLYSSFSEQRQTALAVVFAFASGEVWSVDSYVLKAMDRDGRRAVPPVDAFFRRALQEYGNFLVKLGVRPPFRWIAGMENLKGRGLFIPAPPGQMAMFPGPHGKCLLDVVSDEGLYSPGDSLSQSLKPFFTKLFESCGVPRPQWLDA